MYFLIFKNFALISKAFPDWSIINSEKYGKLQNFGIVTLHVVHDVDICMYAA